MTSRELTSGFDFWSRGHLRMAVTHLPVKFGANIFIQMRSYWHFAEIKDGGRRHLGFVGGAMEPPTKAHSWCVLPVKISSWSHRWVSSYKGLKFLSLRLESPIHAPKFQFLGSFTPKFQGTSFRPPKGTSLRDFTSFELSRVNIHPRVWPVRVPEKKRYK